MYRVSTRGTTVTVLLRQEIMNFSACTFLSKFLLTEYRGDGDDDQKHYPKISGWPWFNFNYFNEE